MSLSILASVQDIPLYQLELIYDDGPLSVNSYTKIDNIAATNQILQDFPVQWLM